MPWKYRIQMMLARGAYKRQQMSLPASGALKAVELLGRLNWKGRVTELRPPRKTRPWCLKLAALYLFHLNDDIGFFE